MAAARPTPFAVRALRALWRLTFDPSYRHLLRLRLLPPRGAFQPFNFTQTDRYPRIFRFVQSSLGADRALRLLSFGCSTGEEVFTLRDHFPHAVIKGIDINPSNIAACRRRLADAGDAAISFAIENSTRGEPAASYDAIFCMAVLRHGNLQLSTPECCDRFIRFADFAAMVEDFERCLKPGGLLVITHSNFRLCDAPAGADFETVLRAEPPAGGARKTPIYGPDNRLLADAAYPDVVFRKTARGATP